MWKKTIQKLHSNDGASISFALFAFIIATVVSLVIVAAALSNVIKLRQERENEQAYLVAESVAYLLMDQIIPTDNGVVTAEDETKETNRYVRILDADETGSNIIVSSPKMPTPADETTAKKYMGEPFQSTIEEMCKSRYDDAKNKNPINYLLKTSETSVTVSVSDDAPDALKEKVNASETTITCYMPQTKVDLDGSSVKLNVPDYYDMDFLISVPTYGTKSYVCRLHFDAAIEKKDNAYYVYWPSATLIKGKGETTP